MEAALEAEEQHRQAATTQVPSCGAGADASRATTRAITAGSQENAAGYPDCTIAQRLQKVVSKSVPQVRSKLATSVYSEGRRQGCTEGLKESIPFPFWHDLLFLIVLLEVGIAILAFFARRNLFAVQVLPPNVLSLFFEVPLVNALRVLRDHSPLSAGRTGGRAPVLTRRITFDRAISSTS